MKPLIYLATFLVALVSVAMGVDLVNAPPVRITARAPVEIRHEATPQPAPSPPTAVTQPPAPKALPAPQPAPPMPSVSQQGTPQIYQPEQGARSTGAAPSCNVDACTAAYRTFTASDCTYQPSEGPRKLCAK